MSAFGYNPYQSMVSGLNWGRSSADDAVKTAQSGLNTVLSGGGVIQSAIGNMNNQASNVIGQANLVNRTADDTRSVYDRLTPLADTLKGYGDDLWTKGMSLTEQANDVFGQGGALVRMDPNATGLAGEYIKYWNSLSPDRYVSQAASDTQAAQQNAMDQAQRNLSRMGVSPTSGAYGALQKQYQQTLATALAAAKTKARQVGLDQQAAQLDKMVGAANTLYNMGNQTQSQALAAQGAAADAQKGAGSIISAQGSGYAQVADLQAKAGALFGSAADIFGNAGKLQDTYLNTLNTAYHNLSSAQLAAADYYRQAVATEVAAVNGSSGGSSGGGKTVTVGSSGSSSSKSSGTLDHYGTGLSTYEWNKLTANQQSAIKNRFSGN